MKIYEYTNNKSAIFDTGYWYYIFQCGGHIAMNPTDWRQIDPDPTVAHTIELESCNAVITAESCYFRDAAAPVITLEEMQRVTKCMEMLRGAGR